MIKYESTPNVHEKLTGSQLNLLHRTTENQRNKEGVQKIKTRHVARTSFIVRIECKVLCSKVQLINSSTDGCQPRTWEFYKLRETRKMSFFSTSLYRYDVEEETTQSRLS